MMIINNLSVGVDDGDMINHDGNMVIIRKKMIIDDNNGTFWW